MDWPNGQAAFVTGAASGIGLGIARALVARGTKVALADIEAARLAEVAEELTARGGTVTTEILDVGDAEQWTVAAEHAESALGPISILVNNAGVTGGSSLDRTPLDVWQWVYRINVEGQFLGISTFLPRMKQRGGRAHIVNTASMGGILPVANVGAYSSSKFAGVGLSLILREEVAGTDIGVSVLCPGSVATRIAVSAADAQVKSLGRASDASVVEMTNSALSQGADPDRVGTQVVEAIGENQFFIVTHRDYLPTVQSLHREIEEAFANFDGRHGADPAFASLSEGGPVPRSD